MYKKLLGEKNGQLSSKLISALAYSSWLFFGGGGILILRKSEMDKRNIMYYKSRDT